MKYDIERSLGEIMKRGEALTIRKHRRAAAITGTLSGLMICLMAAVFYNINDFTGTEMISSNYGAFLLSREAGMYVFLGVVFFVLGSAVSLGVIRYLENKRKPEKKEERTNDQTA